ncbi:hypothetical protein [Caldimonas tepidiphila]|uniref:hypothetical protein n=1 Tax=Caldimonas tepidiphila TaxID=2315841 RepID=UPI000E5A29B8|nr:hypothetical protein [Caldimonas tepidiphila]
MFDFSQLSFPLVGIAVFFVLVALRCGLLWLGGSALVAWMVAHDPQGIAERLMYVLGIDSQEVVPRLAQVLGM